MEGTRFCALQSWRRCKAIGTDSCYTRKEDWGHWPGCALAPRHSVCPSAARTKTVTDSHAGECLASLLLAPAVCSPGFLVIISSQYQHPEQLGRYQTGRERLFVLSRTAHWARRWGTWVQTWVLPLAGSLGLSLSLSTMLESDQRLLPLLPHQEVMLPHFPPWEGDLRFKFYSEKRLGHSDMVFSSIKWR